MRRGKHTWDASIHSMSEWGKSFHKIATIFLIATIKNLFTSKCCSPSIRMGGGGGFMTGHKDESMTGFKRLQWKTWIDEMQP